MNYAIEISNNKRVGINYVCFGMLNDIPTFKTATHRWDYNSKLNKGGITMPDVNAKNIRAVLVEYIRSSTVPMHIKEKPRFNRLFGKMFLEYIEKVFESFPCVSDIVTIHPKLKAIRVRTYDEPADKVMFALTLITRSITTVSNIYDNHCGCKKNIFSLAEFSEQYFSDFKEKFLFTSLIAACRSVDFMSGLVKYFAAPEYITESNLFNGATFGKKSLARFIKNEPIEWVQQPLNRTRSGYMRDTHFISNMIFSDSADRQLTMSYCTPMDRVNALG